MFFVLFSKLIIKQNICDCNLDKFGPPKAKYMVNETKYQIFYDLWLQKIIVRWLKSFYFSIYKAKKSYQVFHV